MKEPYIKDGLIILPEIGWQQHYKVQEWINGTDNMANFVIDITYEKGRMYDSMVQVAIKPTTKKILFSWKLHGLDKLQQEILDYKPQR